MSCAVLLYSIYWFRNICRYTLARFEPATFYERPDGPKECKMRNVSYLGLCWAMTLGLVAVALGQQPANTLQNAPRPMYEPGAPAQKVMQPPQQGNEQAWKTKSSAEWQQDEARRMERPQAPDDSLITGTYQPGAEGTDEGQRRGELGVWMGETGGPGVAILRITPGSAAEQAGLRVGDIILQVNERGASSPQETAKLIRHIGIGQKGNLMVWRDGNQHQMPVTLRAREIARQAASETSHRVGFGKSDSADSELASRTMKLEQQISSLTQELATLRQELAQLRKTGPVQTGFSADTNQPAPPQDRYIEPPKSQPAAATNPTPPPPGFAPPQEAATPPPAEAAKPAAEAPKAAAPPTAPPAPAAEKSDDLFGSDPAQPKSEEKPKTEEQPKAEDKGGSDDLFK